MNSAITWFKDFYDAIVSVDNYHIFPILMSIFLIKVFVGWFSKSNA